MFHIEQPADIEDFLPVLAADRQRIAEARAYLMRVYEAADREAKRVAERKAHGLAERPQAEGTQRADDRHITTTGELK